MHWTISCSAVMDGVGKIRIGDAIWPVVDMVVSVLVTIATAGFGSALTGKKDLLNYQ